MEGCCRVMFGGLVDLLVSSEQRQAFRLLATGLNLHAVGSSQKDGSIGINDTQIISYVIGEDRPYASRACFGRIGSKVKIEEPGGAAG